MSMSSKKEKLPCGCWSRGGINWGEIYRCETHYKEWKTPPKIKGESMTGKHTHVWYFDRHVPFIDRDGTKGTQDFYKCDCGAGSHQFVPFEDRSGKQRVLEILTRFEMSINPNLKPLDQTLTPINYQEALDSIEEVVREQYREGWNALMKRAINDKIMPVDKFGNPPYVLMDDLVGRWDSK